MTVFVVKTESAVRRLLGDGNKFTAGFYRPVAGRPVAVVSTITPGGEELDFSMIALLHEYAHHFMISSTAYPLPRWLSEGSAEFYSSASFYPDGSVGIGQAAQHRAAEFAYAESVSAEELLDPVAYDRKSHKLHDEFYAKSWLLYHYLFFNKERGGQLRRYFELLLQGKAQRAAALEAFGEFKALDSELATYLGKNRIMALKVPASSLKIGATSIRPLSPGEAAMMPVRVQSSVGVKEDQAKAVVADARAIAAQYPHDAAVLTALAEAEYDAGDDKAALAAADGALALDPKQVNAYVQKGYAMFRMAADAKNPDAAFREARTPFVLLNRLEPDHPLPLIWYYRSFTEMGEHPSPVAVEGLNRAVELAPYDQGLRMTLVTQELRDHLPADARKNLMPIAYDPHGQGAAKLAQAMLARLDKQPDWDGSGLNLSDQPDDEGSSGQKP